MSKFSLYFHTLKYLKREQIFYRLKYFIRNKLRKLIHFRYSFQIKSPRSIEVTLIESIAFKTSLLKNNTFIFLNLTKKFTQDINWDFEEYGKLWAYNLNYFEFLNQEQKTQSNEIDSQKQDLEAIFDNFIQKLPILKNGLEPFPISLRVINWIKYFSFNRIHNTQYDQSLYAQLNILSDNLEYHLLGNHLLENGFALLFGAIYFQDTSLFDSANKILSRELPEQILSDGAHFELCPMYHKLMLFRILDCYNLLDNNTFYTPSVYSRKVSQLKDLLASKAALMLGWLSNMTYKNGTTPNFGDSTEGIAPTSKQLYDYAQRLNIKTIQHPLSTSGYRQLINNNFELIAKIGQIGPDYIPGHAHSDTFSFVLNIDEQPFIVDTGISTYNKNEQRQLERSTVSHNTVQIENIEQSEVWGGFRVGRRAQSIILKDTPSVIAAQHDGFSKIGITSIREFELSEKSITITDTIDNAEGKAYFHFHPSHSIVVKDNAAYISSSILKFDSAQKIEVQTYNYAGGFNSLRQAQKITVWFKGSLQTTIHV